MSDSNSNLDEENELQVIILKLLILFVRYFYAIIFFKGEFCFGLLYCQGNYAKR